MGKLILFRVVRDIQNESEHCKMLEEGVSRKLEVNGKEGKSVEMRNKLSLLSQEILS